MAIIAVEDGVGAVAESYKVVIWMETGELMMKEIEGIGKHNQVVKNIHLIQIQNPEMRPKVNSNNFW